MYFKLYLFILFAVICSYTLSECSERVSKKHKHQVLFESREYYNNPCNYTSPFSFSSPGGRLSRVKCFEQLWEIKRDAEDEKQKQDCLSWKLGIHNHVIGGRQAKPGEFPHMGALGWRAAIGTWIFKCGSTLISSRFLLTAAHCSKVPSRDTSVANPVPEIVRLGDKNIADVHANYVDPYDIRIKRIVNHPNFNSPDKYFDIAIIELKEDVKFSKFIQPACLWTDFDIGKLGKEATVTGWGVTETAGKKTSPELQAVVLDFIDSNSCDRLLIKYKNRQWNGLVKHQICAGKLAGGKDACQGDSGGPLQVKKDMSKDIKWLKNDVRYIVGVTSFGIRCAVVNLPGVYTRIASFADWIENVVWRGL